MDISQYTITNIRRGKAADGRAHMVYATLKNEKGETIIQAELAYIVRRVEEMTQPNHTDVPKAHTPHGDAITRLEKKFGV